MTSSLLWATFVTITTMIIIVNSKVIINFILKDESWSWSGSFSEYDTIRKTPHWKHWKTLWSLWNVSHLRVDGISGMAEIDHAERAINVRGSPVSTPFCLKITLEIPQKLPSCQMWTFSNKLCCLSCKLAAICNIRKRRRCKTSKSYLTFVRPPWSRNKF